MGMHEQMNMAKVTIYPIAKLDGKDKKNVFPTSRVGGTVQYKPEVPQSHFTRGIRKSNKPKRSKPVVAKEVDVTAQFGTTADGEVSVGLKQTNGLVMKEVAPTLLPTYFKPPPFSVPQPTLTTDLLLRGANGPLVRPALISPVDATGSSMPTAGAGEKAEPPPPCHDKHKPSLFVLTVGDGVPREPNYRVLGEMMPEPELPGHPHTPNSKGKFVPAPTKSKPRAKQELKTHDGIPRGVQ